MSRVESVRHKVKDSSDDSKHEIHKVNSTCIETPWRSVYIAGAICYTVAAQFSLFFSSIWPYMQILDSTISEQFFGYIVAAYSLGQIIGSPLVGFWSNKAKNIRYPLIACLLLSVAGNLIYISAALISHDRKYAILISRLTLGLGAASIGLLRTYAATASTKEDRTKAIAYVTGGFALGMSSGPAIQLAFIPLGYPGITIVNKLTISMYNSPAWIGFGANILGILLIQCCFVEKYAGLVNKVEVQENGEVKKVKLPAYDTWAVLICYVTRIGAPLVMTNYAFTKTETVKYLAIAHTILSGLAFCVYMSFIVFKIEKYIKFRKHLILAISGLMLFHFITFPYPFWSKLTKTYTDEDLNNEINGTEPVGCNESRLSWCDSATPPPVWVYFISFTVFIGLCFPNINLSIGTLFSNILGPRRQATQQGIMQMSGSLARLTGPIFISNLYTAYGPRWAWILEIIVLAITILIWLVFYKRMVPLKLDDEIPPPLPSESPPPLSLSSSTDEKEGGHVTRLRF